MIRIAILCIATIIGLCACKKDEPQPGNPIADIIECNATQNLDSTAISAKLIGSWTWKKQSLPHSDQFKDADKNIQATFSADSTFSVKENSDVIVQGTWKLIYYSANHYALQTNEYNQYIGGEVYFCDNQLLFSQTPFDGLDNLFEK